VTSPAGLRRPVAALLAALAVAAATGGCDRATGTTSTTTSTTTTKAATVQDPKAVLAREVTALRAVVDGLAAAGVRSVLTGDQQSPCSYGQSGDYPISWSYSRRVFTGTPDSRPLAGRLAASLREQGWSVTPFGDPDADKISLTAQKGGARIGLDAGSTDGGVAVTGYAACVGADGSVRGTPIA
jgi:hypothetical protein